jgi:hypothetical protein
MPEIISRGEAIERGLKRYFTGKPCKRGHIFERHVADKNCIECRKEKQKTPGALAAQAFRQKKRYHKNNGHMRAYHRNHYPKTADRLRRIRDLIRALRAEMPDLLKEFGL